MITGILLAAGEARRFGGAKLLQPLTDGRPIGLASLQALQGPLARVIAVVAPGQAAVADLFANAGAQVLTCAPARAGLGASLACGVRVAPEDAWLIALGDMPCIRASTVARVAAALADGAALAAPTYRGRRGHPVGFSNRFFPALSVLQGDDGARCLLEAHRQDLVLIPTDDAGVLIDVDTPADLAGLPATPPRASQA